MDADLLWQAWLSARSPHAFQTTGMVHRPVYRSSGRKDPPTRLEALLSLAARSSLGVKVPAMPCPSATIIAPVCGKTVHI